MIFSPIPAVLRFQMNKFKKFLLFSVSVRNLYAIDSIINKKYDFVIFQNIFIKI